MLLCLVSLQVHDVVFRTTLDPPRELPHFILLKLIPTDPSVPSGPLVGDDTKDGVEGDGGEDDDAGCSSHDDGCQQARHQLMNWPRLHLTPSIRK